MLALLHKLKTIAKGQLACLLCGRHVLDFMATTIAIMESHFAALAAMPAKVFVYDALTLANSDAPHLSVVLLVVFKAAAFPEVVAAVKAVVVVALFKIYFRPIVRF